MNVNYNSNMYSIIIIILIISIIIISCVTIEIIVSEIPTLSPSFISFTSFRSPSLSNSRSSGFGECRFRLRSPSSSKFFVLAALFSASSGVSKNKARRCSCGCFCMSDVLPALCHSPFLTTLPLLTFFLVSIFPVVLFLIEQ